MSERKIVVRVKVDVSRFIAELRRASEAVNRWGLHLMLLHAYQHHCPEEPVRSAMHAAYDRRRRARRARGRR